jgi:hypothetical protein
VRGGGDPALVGRLRLGCPEGGRADFAAGLAAGFAWSSGGDTVAAPPLYATANSGRTWHLFIPHLVTR